MFLSLPTNPSRTVSQIQAFFCRRHSHGTLTFLTTEPSQRVLARSVIHHLETIGVIYHNPKNINQSPWFMTRDITSPEGQYAWRKCMKLIMQQTSPTVVPSCSIINLIILPGVYLSTSQVFDSERHLYEHYINSSSIVRLYLMNQCLHILGFDEWTDTLDYHRVLERLIGMDYVMQKMIVGYYYEILDYVLDHVHNRGNSRLMMSSIQSEY